MEADEIKHKIKKIIANITSIPAHEIADEASYQDDLGLDSLSALEVVIDVEYEFQFKVPEDEVAGIRTVKDTVSLVQRHLCVEVA